MSHSYTILLLAPTGERAGPQTRVSHLIESQHHTQTNTCSLQTVDLEMNHAAKHLQTDIGTLPLG